MAYRTKPSTVSGRPKTRTARRPISNRARHSYTPTPSRISSNKPKIHSSTPGYKRPMRLTSPIYNGGLRKNILTLIGCALCVILAFFLISNVKSCREQRLEAELINKARIAPGTPQDLADKIEPKLKEGDMWTWIAANTDKYENTALIELAIREPDALEFVYMLPSAEKTSSSYDESVLKGVAPKLFCWDKRWGYVDYNGQPLGLTGDAPVVFAMAYMGLTGQVDQTPASIGILANNKDYFTSNGDTTAEFFEKNASALGLKIAKIKADPSVLNACLANRNFVIAHFDSSRNSNKGHWVILVDHDQDGSITLYDPTSTSNSNHTWDPQTIAKSCDTFFQVSANDSSKN